MSTLMVTVSGAWAYNHAAFESIDGSLLTPDGQVWGWMVQQTVYVLEAMNGVVMCVCIRL